MPVYFVYFMDSIFIFFNIYFLERERQSKAREGQRERETQNQKQAPGSELSAQSLKQGLKPQTVRSWPSRSRSLNQLSHPGAPTIYYSSIAIMTSQNLSFKICAFPNWHINKHVNKSFIFIREKWWDSNTLKNNFENDNSYSCAPYSLIMKI